jgi:hypothetical protein
MMMRLPQVRFGIVSVEREHQRVLPERGLGAPLRLAAD